MMNNETKTASGFTLIEAVLIMVVVSILAVASMSILTSASDEERFADTILEMKEIRKAMVGDWEPEQVKIDDGTRSHRKYFGFLGNIGGLPPDIPSLYSNPGYPAFAYDSALKTAAGWNGSYLNSTFSTTNYRADAWGTDYQFDPGANPPTLTSYGADRAAGGVGLNADITLTIPTTVTSATVRGAILSSGAQWDGDAEVYMHYPDGNGTLTSMRNTIAAGGLGEYEFRPIPQGVRSVMIYIPDQATATADNTFGPYITVVDRPTTLVNFDLTMPTPAFVPTDLAGLILWLDGNDPATLWKTSACSASAPVVADGGVVGCWLDKSGNNFHATQPGTRPTLKLAAVNGKNAILFDGSATYYSLPATFGRPTQYTIFVQFSSTSAATAATAVLGASDAAASVELNWGMIGLSQSGLPVKTIAHYVSKAAGRTSYSHTSAGVIGAGNQNIVDLRYITGDSMATIYHNGTLQGLTAIMAGSNNHAGAATTFSIGRLGDVATSNYFKGTIAEVVIYGRNLTDTERDQVRTYLNAKWATY